MLKKHLAERLNSMRLEHQEMQKMITHLSNQTNDLSQDKA